MIVFPRAIRALFGGGGGGGTAMLADGFNPSNAEATTFLQNTRAQRYLKTI